MHGIFITGTDTDVGKTHITAWLANHLIRAQAARSIKLRIGAYKPVCSGSVINPATGESQWSDVERLWESTGRSYSKGVICPQTFAAPLAPPVAARLEGKHVCAKLLRSGLKEWEKLADILLIEGVGGWLAPLSETETVADFAAEVEFPVLVVAAQRLGMISHTLLTLESIRNRGLNVLGVIVNEVFEATDLSADTNIEELQR
ncbi:UNVERIFIED_CONTAM: hypothetical protein GTU68_067537 [Idotea baltica]|nr:hypothetical protein [Idotea baltica]